MEFKHFRGSFLIIFEKLIEIPLIVLGVLASIFLLKNFDMQALVPVVFILLSPISKLVNYFFTYYTLTEDYMIVESGVFTKKRTEIPFSTITTVDLSQNILFQLFKVYKIKVDNSSQTNEIANKSNVILTLKIEEAILFKQKITKSSELQEVKVKDSAQQHDEINTNLLDFVKLGLLQSKLVYIFSIFAVAGPLFGVISPNLKNTFVGALLIFAIIIIYVIAVGMSVIKSVVTYYNFKVWSEEDVLKVQYGLFNKKSFSLQKGKISGIILKQSLLMKLCKLYTVEAIVIGYGDNSEDNGKEKAIIFPIASMDRIKEIVNIVLPEYSLDYSLCKPEPRALRYFFINPVLVFTVISFISALTISILTNIYFIIAFASLFLAISIVGAILGFLNAGISIGESNVVLSAGSYSKKIAVIKTKSIESVTASGTIFKRRKGIISIKLGFIAPLRLSNISTKNIPVTQFDLLEGVLKY